MHMQMGMTPGGTSSRLQGSLKQRLTLVEVMSMTSHFMRGRIRKFLVIISRMHILLKSMFVRFWQPASYLQIIDSHIIMTCPKHCGL